MSPEAQARARDAQARAEAQREFARPLVVRAGAGTGKTAALTARVVAWTLGEGWRRAEARAGPPASGADAIAERHDELARDVLARVVAITFTEAASAEMAERIEEALGEIERGGRPDWVDEAALPSLEERQPRARALREALDHLAVKTIHAWCRSLLARFPLAARLRPDFEVDASGRARLEATQHALERALRDDYASGGPLLELARAGVGPARVLETALALAGAGVRAGDLAADPCPRAAVEHLVGALRDAAQRLAALRPAAMPSNRDTNAAHEVFDRAADTADALRALDVEDDELVATVWVDIGAMWSERVAKVGQWSRGETLTKIAKHFERVEDVVEAAAALREPLETVRSVDPRVLRASFAALGGVLGAVERELADRGVLGFDDLLRGARDLLVSRPAVAAQLRGEIEQLLVDEFQDTDALQCDLVRALALPRAADDDGPRPGLFLVGDPKQSIYGWRDADLGAYEAFVGDVVRAGGRALELAVNFRSVPAVLAEVERSLAHAMQAEPGVQAAFEPLFASERNASAPGFAQDGGAGGDVEGDAPRWAPVEHWVSWDVAGGEKRSGPETRTAAATRVEARAFARDVRRLRDEHGVALERVALLVRQRGDVDVYLRALREEGVPYSAHAGPELASRREAVDAAAVLRCVLDPNDQIALVALLRSACVGVPDAALLPLWVGRLPQRFAELDGEPGGEGAAALAAVEALAREVAASLDAEVVPELAAVAGWEESLVAAARAVARLRASFERDAPDVFVERLRAELALDLAEAARFPGALRVANLARFHRELAEDLAAGCDEQVLLRRLRTGGARGRGAGEPVAVVPGAVQVMTIHGAKGLGFDHVYLAQVHKAASGGRARATEVERGIDGPEMRLLGTQTLGFARAKAARARRESAESVRALYVALTRAKQRLVVMGARPGDAKRAKLVDATAVRSLSYAELLALRDDAPDLDAPFGEGCARFVAGDALWRFPALDPDPPADATGPARSERWPSAEDAARAAERAASARAAASARMARPRTAAVSSEARADALERAARALEPLVDEQGEPVAARDESERATAVEGEARSERGAGARGSAARVGTAVHALLEGWDFGADPERELAHQRARLPAVVASLGAEGEVAVAAEAAAAREVLDAFAATALFERFAQLGGEVVARELPVLVPPASAATGPSAAGADGVGAIDGLVGAIDLVLRTPDGDWVVVDYKTDDVRDDAALRERGAHYAGQGRAYARALRDALGLERSPAFELWFLRTGAVVRPLAEP